MTMEPMSEGMNLNPEILTGVLQNKIASAAIREAQLEAGIQTALAQEQGYVSRIDDLEKRLAAAYDAGKVPAQADEFIPSERVCDQPHVIGHSDVHSHTLEA